MFYFILGYTCRCDRGFHLNVGGSSCIDEDECRSGVYCRGGRCLNTLGSFTCECPLGFRPSFDRKVVTYVFRRRVLIRRTIMKYTYPPNNILHNKNVFLKSCTEQDDGGISGSCFNGRLENR